MNKYLISIYGSSYILPNNRSWKPLLATYNIKFSDFDAWKSDFFQYNQKSNGIPVWIIFFQDIFSLSKINEFESLNNREEIDSILNEYFTPLKHLLQKNNNTIVGHSSLLFENENSIENSQKESIRVYISKKIKLFLSKMKSSYKNLYLINLDRIFAKDGIKENFSSRNFYSARCHLNIKGIKNLAIDLKYILDRIYFPRKKVLILDCDNTLWGGVLGDLGLEKIQIGQDGIGKAFEDFQNEILKLQKRGTLLAIASKNNQQDVFDVLINHSSMILKKEHITNFKVNWDDKPNNIKKIAKELSLGLDSFVFWDDNPIERDMVKTHLPEVNTIEIPEDVAQWPILLRTLPDFSQFHYIDDDYKKAEQYKSRAQFNTEIEDSIDKTIFLKNIQMSPTLQKIDKTNFNRAHQLILKTNQFNLRTIRHSSEKFKAILANNNSLSFILSLQDKFGDHGYVGLIIIQKENSNNYAWIDSLILSCRVIGRHLESWILNKLVAILKEERVEYLLGEYIQTSKNKPIENFLTNHNFIKSEINIKNLNIPFKNKSFYQLNINNQKIPHIEVFSK